MRVSAFFSLPFSSRDSLRDSFQDSLTARRLLEAGFLFLFFFVSFFVFHILSRLFLYWFFVCVCVCLRVFCFCLKTGHFFFLFGMFFLEKKKKKKKKIFFFHPPSLCLFSSFPLCPPFRKRNATLNRHWQTARSLFIYLSHFRPRIYITRLLPFLLFRICSGPLLLLPLPPSSAAFSSSSPSSSSHSFSSSRALPPGPRPPLPPAPSRLSLIGTIWIKIDSIGDLIHSAESTYQVRETRRSADQLVVIPIGAGSIWRRPRFHPHRKKWADCVDVIPIGSFRFQKS